VIVVQADLAGTHQPRRHLAEPRAADHLLVVRDASPVAKVLEEAARAGAAALERALARRSHVLLDPGAQAGDLHVVQQPAHDAGSVALELGGEPVEIVERSPRGHRDKVPAGPAT